MRGRIDMGEIKKYGRHKETGKIKKQGRYKDEGQIENCMEEREGRK